MFLSGSGRVSGPKNPYNDDSVLKSTLPSSKDKSSSKSKSSKKGDKDDKKI